MSPDADPADLLTNRSIDDFTGGHRTLPPYPSRLGPRYRKHSLQTAVLAMVLALFAVMIVNGSCPVAGKLLAADARAARPP